jgi:hypothetical protein
MDLQYVCIMSVRTYTYMYRETERQREREKSRNHSLYVYHVRNHLRQSYLYERYDAMLNSEVQANTRGRHSLSDKALKNWCKSSINVE